MATTRRKRNVLEILEELLGILLEEREASKTKLTNRANLNLNSFNRYIELLVKAGAAVEKSVDGRVVYAATPRTAALFLMVEALRRASQTPPEVVARYEQLVASLTEALKEAGYLVRVGRILDADGERIFYDIEASGDCTLGYLVAVKDDPLNCIRAWSIALWAAGYRPRGIDDVIVVGDDPLVSRLARLLGVRVAIGVEDIFSRGAC